MLFENFIQKIIKMKIIKPEFQAVIMAGGKGSRMPEVSSSRPKCLLPIGNKPLIWYPLQMLEKAGFLDVIVVVLETQKVEIQKVVDKTDLKIKIDYVTIPSTEDLGTADSLRLISDKIVSDIIVVSCDFITDLNLNPVLDLFRRHDASVVSLLFEDKQEPVPLPGPKTKNKPERDLIGIDLNTNRLVFQASSSDFDEFVSFSKKLIRKHPNITIFSRLLDSHFYIIKHWILNYISHEKSFSTIKGELLPHIVKKQLSKKPKLPDAADKNQSIVNAEVRNDVYQFIQEDELDEKVRNTSSYNDHTGDLKPTYHGDIIKCYSHIVHNNFGIRVNTLQSYCLANAKILEKWNLITSTNIMDLVRIHPNAEIHSNQVDEQCLIGEGTVIAEKTSIRNSFIGSNCVVNSKVRVFNCILMNNVRILGIAFLQNCIICDGVTIESQVELKDCLVGNNHTIPEGSNHCNEILTADDKLMEI